MGNVNSHVLICLCAAGVTSENVAAKYGIARDTQDKMAVSSHQRAAKARDTGRFKDEIVPVKTMWKDPKSGVARHAVSSIHANHVHNRSASYMLSHADQVCARCLTSCCSNSYLHMFIQCA